MIFFYFFSFNDITSSLALLPIISIQHSSAHLDWKKICVDIKRVKNQHKEEKWTCIKNCIRFLADLWLQKISIWIIIYHDDLKKKRIFLLLPIIIKMQHRKKKSMQVWNNQRVFGTRTDERVAINDITHGHKRMHYINIFFIVSSLYSTSIVSMFCWYA